MSKVNALKQLLHPKSVAIIGVSQDFTSIGGKPLKNLIRHQYRGNIYPINPKYREVGGYPCYASIKDVPGDVDVALIAVSQARVLEMIRECAEKQVKHAVLFGAGFAEVGEEGKHLQDELMNVAAQHGIHIIGPNCIGCLNVKDRIPLGFATSFETDKGFVAGNVGLASQSGAHGFSIFGLAQEENIGFSYVINTGNQMDITTLDCMSFMLEDPETHVVAAYMEGIPDGEQLIRLANRAKELCKPLIILKSGRSALGKQAALSHTASMAGSQEMFQAVARQYGIIQVNDIDEMIDNLKIFARGKKAEGPRLAAVTNSGASGIVMADYSEELGLELIRLSEETKKKIEAIIPSYGSALNPIDITAQALKEQNLFSDTLDVLVGDEQVDLIVVQTTFGGPLGKKICEKVVEIDQKTEKPIVMTLTGTAEITGEGREVLQKARVPVYQTSSRTMAAMKKLVEFSRFCRETKSEGQMFEISQLQEERLKSGVWTEEKVKDLLSDIGIRVPKGTIVRNTAELEAIQDQIRYPVVCKVISKDILHKTDAGGVIVNIQDGAQLLEAYGRILHSVTKHRPDAAIDGILIEEMIADKGVEMFIGVKDDPQFGPFVVCGLGGIFIEVLKDISIRHAPIGLEEAHAMLKELKGYPMLLGVRGGGRRDIDAMAQALALISRFARENQGLIQEMDINPVLVLEEGKGIAALDGMIVWKKKLEEKNEI